MNDIRAAAKLITARHNVSFRVIDSKSGKIVSTHTGHNAATNSLLTGIGHYLTGDGILNQGYPMLYNYIPKYISLGTMGLINQEQDGEGLPAGIGVISGTEEERFVDYMMQTPGYGADGYDPNINNNRAYFGLGPIFANREAEVFTETLQVGDLNRDGKVDEEDVQILANYIGGELELEPWQVVVADLDHNGRVDCQDLVDLVTFVNSGAPIEDLGTIEYSNDTPATINCELISDSFPRAKISFRDIVPETESEFPQTIDIVFSAMISTGALAQFREPGRDYLFITEAGLWSKKEWSGGGDNGLLAGYRIAPPNTDNWGMISTAVTDEVAIKYLQNHGVENPSPDEIYQIKPTVAEENRKILKQNIIRVGVNQVVQVIWKIQLGGMDQLGGLSALYPSNTDCRLYWIDW